MANSRKEISFFHGASTESSIGNSKRGSVSPEFPFFFPPPVSVPVSGASRFAQLRNSIGIAVPSRVLDLFACRRAGFFFPRGNLYWLGTPHTVRTYYYHFIPYMMYWGCFFFLLREKLLTAGPPPKFLRGSEVGSLG
jgi:hypothetical protein